MKNFLKKKRTVIGQLLIIVAVWASGIIWSNKPSGIPDEYIKESSYYEEAYTYSRTEKREISSAEEWIAFSNDVKNGMDYSSYTIYLTADLNFECYEEIMPVGDDSNPFRGTLCGNNHTISNLNISSEEQYVGLFGFVENALIQELSLQNCDIKSVSAIGTGGIAGFAENSEIKGCAFNGSIFAESGSIGGIAGNNWSLICNCDVYGDVSGSTQNGVYGIPGMKNSYGTGGICGDNGGIIFKCRNYAEVFDDSETHESNTVRSGGITGYNNGLIDSCVNYGNVTGGGICISNSKYATIRCCFNTGDVYSGISVGSYQDSVIEYCVNLGRTAGRYAGDIVSFWGQDSEENTWGCISDCLYINSSKAGVARRKSFSSASLNGNSRIRMTDDKSMTQINQYLERDEYCNAYQFLVERERRWRLSLTFTVSFLVALSIFILNVIAAAKIRGYTGKLYRTGVSCFKKGDYWDGYKSLCEIAGYKDSEDLLKRSVNELLAEGNKTGILWMGECFGKKIEWHKIKEENDSIYFIAANALAVDRINADPVPVSWEKSELAIKLNSVYKETWFGKKIESYLAIDISIPDIESITKLYPLSQQRKCGNPYRLEGALMNSGNVYWWLKSDQQTGRMPFVTSDGLISERGKTVMTDNIAVRPVIKVRILYENNI